MVATHRRPRPGHRGIRAGALASSQVMATAQARPGAPTPAMTGSGSVQRRQWLAARAAAAAARAPATAAAALALTVLGTHRPWLHRGRAQAPASATDGTGHVKYYIVPPPAHGAVPTLYSIAAATLGNGSLYMEIFKLDKGRLQPNGQRLANPHSVEPGWILPLPPDASGPGVHSGPLPAAAKADLAGRTPGVPPPPGQGGRQPRDRRRGLRLRHDSGTRDRRCAAGLRRRRAGPGSAQAPPGRRREPAQADARQGGRPWQRLGPRPGRGPPRRGGSDAVHRPPGLARERPRQARRRSRLPGPASRQRRPGLALPRPPGLARRAVRAARSPRTIRAGPPPTSARRSAPPWTMADRRALTARAGPIPTTRAGQRATLAARWPTMTTQAGRPQSPAAGGRPGQATGAPGPAAARRAGLPQRERLSAAPAPAVHHDPNPRQPVPQVPPARGRHVRVPVGYSSHPGPADDTPQRWSAQLARTTGPIPQTYYDLAFGDGRLQVMLTESPPSPGWPTTPGGYAGDVLQLPSAETAQRAAPASWADRGPRQCWLDPGRLGPGGRADPGRCRPAGRRDQAGGRLPGRGRPPGRRAGSGRDQAPDRGRGRPIREAAEQEAAEIREQATAQAAAIRQAAEREAAEMRAAMQSMSGELHRVAAYVTQNLATPGAPPAALPATAPAALPAEPGTRPARPAAKPTSEAAAPPAGHQAREASRQADNEAGQPAV